MCPFEKVSVEFVCLFERIQVFVDKIQIHHSFIMIQFNGVHENAEWFNP